MSRKGEVLTERTIAETTTDSAGRWELYAEPIGEAGRLRMWLRALCPGGPRFGAAVSEPLRVSAGISLVAPAANRPSNRPLPRSAEPRICWAGAPVGYLVVITVLLLIETALLVLVVVFVVGLLRSHAEILRRLAAVEGYGAERGAVPERMVGASTDAFDIVGETLAGDSVKVRLGPGSPTTLLAFLSSGCAACGPLWEGLRRDSRVPAGVRLVIVVKGPEEESATRLRELAPRARELLMSTGAWHDYSIPGSPHFVLVDGGSGAIAGRGTAASWEQMLSMVEQATSDSSTAGAEDAPRARTTSERAGRAEQALAAAGITAGHPSLYPASNPPEAGERA
ncbi:MAG: hypothetical protein WAU77_11330 [Solirubrobacteraceae bacterium]